MNGQLKVALVLIFGVGMALFGGRRDAEVPAPVQVSVAPDAPDEVRLRRRGDGHFYVHGMVNGQIVEFLIDTGADSVVLTTGDAARVGLDVDKRRFVVVGSGASGDVRGQRSMLDSVEIEGRTARNMRVLVADGLEQSLLGQDFLTRFNSVQMNGGTMTLR